MALGGENDFFFFCMMQTSSRKKVRRLSSRSDENDSKTFMSFSLKKQTNKQSEMKCEQPSGRNEKLDIKKLFEMIGYKTVATTFLQLTQQAR